MTLQLPDLPKVFREAFKMTMETPAPPDPKPEPEPPAPEPLRKPSIRYPPGVFPGTLYLEITQQHITDATGGSFGCPVALAAWELFGHPGIHVAAASGNLTIMSDRQTLAVYRGGPEVKRFMDRFDATHDHMDAYGAPSLLAPRPTTFVLFKDPIF